MRRGSCPSPRKELLKKPNLLRLWHTTAKRSSRSGVGARLHAGLRDRPRTQRRAASDPAAIRSAMRQMRPFQQTVATATQTLEGTHHVRSQRPDTTRTRATGATRTARGRGARRRRGTAAVVRPEQFMRFCVRPGMRVREQHLKPFLATASTALNLGETSCPIPATRHHKNQISQNSQRSWRTIWTKNRHSHRGAS